MIPILNTPRLLLRPLVEADFADFYEYAQDPAVSGPGMWLPYKSEEEARQDFAEIVAEYDKGLLWWAMEDLTTHKMIGRCELTNYSPKERDARAELSYAMHRNFWGKGLMSEAAQQVTAYGFDTLQLNRVSAIVFTDNEASIRLLEKLGMQREGCLRQYRQIRGKPEDIYMYSVLKAEWQASH